MNKGEKKDIAMTSKKQKQNFGYGILAMMLAVAMCLTPMAAAWASKADLAELGGQRLLLQLREDLYLDPLRLSKHHV